MNTTARDDFARLDLGLQPAKAIRRSGTANVSSKLPKAPLASRLITQGAERIRRRARLYEGLKERPLAGVPPDLVDAQFKRMPARYWERVTKSELAWGLNIVHQFLEKSAGASNREGVVVADCCHCPERGCNKVLVCAWDRPGLLAKIAAAFSALRVDILRADIYTREDGIVLDFFEVRDLDHGSTSNSVRVEHLVFLLEGALSTPPRFVSFWASQFHKLLPKARQSTPRVMIDNESSSEYTLLQVQAADRIGLLYDVLQAMTECGVNIAQAVVETEDHLASDLFYATDFKGKKIMDQSRLGLVQRALIKSLTA